MKRKFNEVSGENPSKIHSVSYEVSSTTMPTYYTTQASGIVNGIVEAELRGVIDNFVKVYESLDNINNIDSKPNYSYTEMVCLAMLRSPNFCLPITEIYRYIATKFPFFRTSGKSHWRNAVRHSLSKTKCFTKIAIGRGIGTSGSLQRSTYLWSIIPSSIINFARGDYRPKICNESGTNTLRWGYYRMNAGPFWERVSTFVEKKMAAFKQNLALSSPLMVLEAQVCELDLPTTILASQVSSLHNKLYTKSCASSYCDTTVTPAAPSAYHATTPPSIARNSISAINTTYLALSPIGTPVYHQTALFTQTSAPESHATCGSLHDQIVRSCLISDNSNACVSSPALNYSSSPYLCASDSGNDSLLDASFSESINRSCKSTDCKMDGAIPDASNVPNYCVLRSSTLSPQQDLGVYFLDSSVDSSGSPYSPRQRIHNYIDPIDVTHDQIQTEINDDLPCLDSFFQGTSLDNTSGGYDFSYWFPAVTHGAPQLPHVNNQFGCNQMFS